jgi:hypothetical protein
MNVRSASAMLVILVATAGCSRASESSEAKRMPKPPPAAESAEPGDKLHIAVEIDGAPAASIDGAKLASTPPDFKDDEHRAWRIATLIGPAADREGVVIAATGEKDVTIVLPRPRAKEDPAPVLTLNRRGDVFATLLMPGEPFPAYHGRGGRLARPGDPLPRVAGVKSLSITLPKDARAP